MNEKKELEKKVKNINTNSSHALKDELQKININDLIIYHSIFNKKDSKTLKSFCDRLLNKVSNTIVILISKSDNKVTSVIGVSRNLTEQLDAVDLIRFVTPILGGKGGGGKTELAQGGGVEPNKAEEAISKTIDYINSKI